MEARSKLDRVPLADLLPRLDLPEAAAALLPAGAAPAAALTALVAAGFLDEAAQLAAHALPRREAVWWACMCAEATAPNSLPEPQRAAFQAAQDWVRRPGDDTSRRAWAAAEQAGMDSPESWCAVAAHWSGSSITPPGLEPVPPPPHLTAVAVLGALKLAAIRTPAAQHAATWQRFIAAAQDIATGGLGRVAP